ncbi:MAG: hypothetical protein N2441_04760 [Rhodocyclaceae bacterium]|nr:hypothetical protein [Rhodocyclaceae bacterium]
MRFGRHPGQSGAKDCTAVVFEDGRLIVVRVAQQKNAAPRLIAHERFAQEGTESEALKRLKPLKKLWGQMVTTLVGPGQYRLQAFDYPAELRSLNDAERREAMRWRAKEMVDFPIEDAGIDVFEMPASGGRPAQLWVVAAPKEVLQARIQAFQDAKISLTTIDIPELAQRNLASFFAQAHRGVALLSCQEHRGLLTICHEDELYVARHIDVGARLLSEAGNEHLRERVLLDIQRTLDNFDRNYGAIPLTSLCVAAPASGEAFVSYLGENLSLPVERVDLGQALDFSETPALASPDVHMEAWYALGAALRDARPPEPRA